MNTLPLLTVLCLAAMGTSCASEPAKQDSMQDLIASFTNATTTVTNAEPVSPRKRLEMNLGDVEVSIDYGSPSAKGREIWGKLVPYGAVWRTGANEATTIETSGDLLVKGQTLPAGHYSIFTIPTSGEWTVIFNERHEQWGAYEYDAALDVLRVMADPVSSPMHESLDFEAGEGGVLLLKWGELALPVAMEPAR